jgi:acyl carrier protein
VSETELLEKMREILAQDFDVDPASVIPGARFAEDLDLDSIDAIDLLIKMKQYTNGKVDPVLFKNARTIQDIITILLPLMQG